MRQTCVSSLLIVIMTKPFADAFPRHRQQIIDNPQQVKEKLADVVTVMQPLESEFLEQVKTAKEEIRATV